MSTDIIPVFGLTLTDSLEIVAICVSASVAAAIGISTVISRRLSNQSMKQMEAHAKQAKEHEEYIRKTASANLVMELKKRFRYEDFREVFQYLHEASLETHNPNQDRSIRMVLNHMEYISTMYEDGVLTEKHVEHVFGGELETIKNSDIVKKVMEDQRKKKPDFYYAHLQLWFDGF